MKRSNGLSQVVLSEVGSRLLSRVFLTLLLIAAMVVPGAAQAIFVNNGTNAGGSFVGYTAAYASNGSTVNSNLLSFSNQTLYGLAYSGGYLFVPLPPPGGFGSSYVNKYNASTAVQDMTFSLSLNAELQGDAVYGNNLFLAGVGDYNTSTGSVNNPLLGNVIFPQYVATSKGTQPNTINVFVTSVDSGNGAPNSGSIQQFVVSSNGVTVLSGPTTLVSNLNYPEGIGVSADGSTVYVAIPNSSGTSGAGEVDAFNSSSGASQGALILNVTPSPIDLAVTGPAWPGGSKLYVTLNPIPYGGNPGTGAVGEYDFSSGNFNPTFITAGLSNPTGIALEPCGTCAVVDPWYWNYTALAVGKFSPMKPFHFSNPGTQAVNIGTIEISGDFQLGTPKKGACIAGKTLAAGASCTIEAAFAPTQTGPRTGAITITDDAEDGPQIVTLSGLGESPKGWAVITSPVPGTTLSGTTATFTWTSDKKAKGYSLDIGSAQGGSDIYQSGDLGPALQTTVDTLPADGSTIYVTLSSQVAGKWYSNSYTYTSRQ